jgi:hypothetical protein
LVVSTSQVVSALSAELGKEYVAYLDGGGTFTLNLSHASETLNAEWYNPTTGAKTNIGIIQNPGASESFTTPSNSAWVLHVWSSTPTTGDSTPAPPTNLIVE